jgi:hypothetical protein
MTEKGNGNSDASAVNAGRQLRQSFSISDPDAIAAAQGAEAAANSGNCPQAVTALNLAQSSPNAGSSAGTSHRISSG